MIVKNESLVIERMLKSVIDIIDYYIIVDTGSTDNTIECIKTFMSSFIQTSERIECEICRR